ncbi:MAG: hypothetical protein H2173_03985 [Opitutus sp.]|nr:hypothetical protein [Opitutus sp.]
MKTLTILSHAFALVLGVTSARAETRTWTSVTGTKVEATLVHQNSTHVDLKLADGRIIHLSKDQLSSDDKTFLVEAGRKVVKVAEVVEKVNYVTLATGLRVVQLKKPLNIETIPKRRWMINKQEKNCGLIARGKEGVTLYWIESKRTRNVKNEELSAADLKY